MGSFSKEGVIIMGNTLEKLRYEDLKIGMHVKPEQVSNLYGVWLYVNPNTVSEDGFDILYFCNETNIDSKKVAEIRKAYGKTSVIYQPKFYEDEDVAVYD